MLQFLNPALVFGALLFSVPLIIHLLNRQRYKRRRWAAMEYLLAAYKKQRRRVRTENLLLLLLRCLIPIALAFAVARPLLRDVAGAGAFASTAHHVLVLDHSYSMGVQPEGTQSPYEKMRHLAGQLLERLEGRAGQKVTIVHAGVRPEMPVRDDLNLGRAKAELAAMPGPQDSAADLTAALLRTADLVEEGGDGDVRVYVFTDLQARAFGRELTAAGAEAPATAPGTAEPAPAGTTGRDGQGGEAARPDAGAPGSLFQDTVRDAIERIGKQAELVLVDVGPDADAGAGRVDNLQLTDLRLQTSHAFPRVPVPVLATLVNRTDVAREPQVTLEVDGAEPMRRTLHLEAGAEGTIEFPVTFRDVGQRRLRASLEPDALAADNERFLIVPVREQVKVLLVEGSGESDPGLQDSSHLRDVLDPTRGDGGPEVTQFATRVVDSTTFLAGRERPADYDLVVLANVEHLNEAAARQLEEAMQRGTGLLAMFGDHTNADSFNTTLHAAGRGPMPLRLREARGFQPEGRESWGIEVVRPQHPVLSDFTAEVYRDLLQAIPVYRVWTSDRQALDEAPKALAAEVLLRTRDPEQSPLLVASTFGEGRALWLTSAMSRRPGAWNELDLDVVAFLLFHGAARWLTLPGVDPFNVEVGAALTATLAKRPSNVAVVLPDRAGAEKLPIGEESRTLPGGKHSLPPFTRTAWAGVYTVEASLDDEGENRFQQLWFAVNPDPAEGDLTFAAHDVVRDRLGVQRIVRGLPSEANAALDAGSSELGPLLLLATLLFLVSEAALARFVSVRRL